MDIKDYERICAEYKVTMLQEPNETSIGEYDGKWEYLRLHTSLDRQELLVNWYGLGSCDTYKTDNFIDELKEANEFCKRMNFVYMMDRR